MNSAVCTEVEGAPTMFLRHDDKGDRGSLVDHSPFFGVRNSRLCGPKFGIDTFDLLEPVDGPGETRVKE